MTDFSVISKPRWEEWRSLFHKNIERYECYGDARTLFVFRKNFAREVRIPFRFVIHMRVRYESGQEYSAIVISDQVEEDKRKFWAARAMKAPPGSTLIAKKLKRKNETKMSTETALVPVVDNKQQRTANKKGNIVLGISFLLLAIAMAVLMGFIIDDRPTIKIVQDKPAVYFYEIIGLSFFFGLIAMIRKKPKGIPLALLALISVIAVGVFWFYRFRIF